MFISKSKSDYKIYLSLFTQPALSNYILLRTCSRVYSKQDWRVVPKKIWVFSIHVLLNSKPRLSDFGFIVAIHSLYSKHILNFVNLSTVSWISGSLNGIEIQVA